MKVIIPLEFQLASHTFQIVWSPTILESQNCRAGCEDRERQIIRLMPGRPISSTLQSLIHEVLHLIDLIYSGEDGSDEKEVRILAAGLTQFLISIGFEPDFTQLPKEKLD